MHLYFGGSEQKGWRELLHANDVTHMSISYVGLTRRTKRAREFVLADHFPEDTRIFVDSGAYTVNKDRDKYPAEVVELLAQDYLAFVANNLDRIEMASEFDADIMGNEWLMGMREDFWHDPEIRYKFLPICKNPSSNLREYADQYQRVGVMQQGNDLMLAPIVNRIVQDKGTQFHGVAMTRMSDMQQVRWHSVGSASWLNTSQYGETFVWDGRAMHWYPKKYKERARVSHKTYLDDMGFDTDAIFADDVNENLRLAIWSWQAFVKFQSYDARHQNMSDGVTQPVPEPFPGAKEIVKDAVAHLIEPERNAELTTRPDKKLLPVVGIVDRSRTEVDAEGNEISHNETLMRSTASSLMRCNNCFIQDHCPSYTPDAECAYELPVVARTTMQRDAIEDTMIEIQTQRVAMLRMMEQIKGGYIDPNLGPEMDRLNRMLVKKATLEEKRNNPTARLTIEATGPAGGGMIAGMFGAKAGEKLHALEAPSPVEEIMAETEIVDAEVVEGEIAGE